MGPSQIVIKCEIDNPTLIWKEIDKKVYLYITNYPSVMLEVNKAIQILS